MSLNIITFGGQDLQFVALDGAMQPAGLQVEDCTRKGFDGVAMRQDASRANVGQLVGVLDTDAPQAMANYLGSLQGQLVTVIDSSQESWSDVIVLSVRIVSSKKIVSAVGGVSATNTFVGSGFSTHLITVVFDVQVGTGAAP